MFIPIRSTLIRYIAASGATDICMLEGGDIMIPGVGFETMFAKGLLDKIGVKADFVQIGEYKGADEEYTRTEASDELKGQLNKLADALYTQIVATISKSRGLDPDKVRALVDDSLITGDEAKAAGLVDHLVDIGGMRDLMADSLGKKVRPGASITAAKRKMTSIYPARLHFSRC